MMANPHRRSGARGNAHRRPVVLAAVSLLTLFVLTACGGGEGGGDRPSVADIEDQIAKSSGEQVTEEQSACLARTYYESDLSDEAVRLLVESEDVAEISPEDLSEADQKASKELYDPLVKCLTPAE
ncbi:hypothetical protein [Nocardioides albus]|uniref:Uncharacterized protein n=1 Tax=Nocardioides albus TaxID=1841 RepID=A0A7W5A059_9ACTN|nr:hypothetical protein [Nocardioides albus]MBB3087105.1 hypothetical protein [Nocardioides albus]GGU06654.1 hypothetical protein GCM10007979_00270 [Nocardioides albus]